MPPRKKSGAPNTARRPRKKAPRAPKLSHLRRPSHLDVKEWQTHLRRQFGRDQSFILENIGSEPVFSEFRVSNPQSGSTYRVAIRGPNVGDNFCACADFATNDLGTCKHIEFVLGRLEGKRGGAKALRQGCHPAHSEIYLQYGGERQVRFRAGSQCPPALVRHAARVFSGPNGALPLDRLAGIDGLLTGASRADHEIRCYEDAFGFIAQARDAEERRRILDEAYPRGAASAALNKLVKAKLYPYQAEGALFAARAGRCLIGDEMGLGKTIQAIAAVELFARHFGAERVLIVCPTSLKQQWQREIARFSERQAQVIGGLRAARESQYAQPGFCKIANYDVLSRDLDLIAAWSPDVVIVDEAQRIKNWNTVAARALKRIASPYAIVLTGTPLENRLEELVSIVQFVDQHRLGPTWRLRHAHQVLDDSGRVVGYRDLDRIGKTLEPILLRRRKSEVLNQLPPRIDNTVFVPMTPEQTVHHDENREIVDRIVHRWRKTGFLSDADQRRLTCALQNMRMSCNSTYLLDQQTDHGSKADELATLLGELFERPDAKAVIFSQWVRTHELITRRLQKNGWGHVLFHGGVPGGQRGAIVDRFHNDPACRVFLSTDAGGVGLNLQHAAAVVINMDLPWNPAVLEQRIGRVYRLGQSRSVQVVNFVAEGTIEERMLSVLAFKKSLFAGVLDGGASEVFLGGSKLEKFMEGVSAIIAPVEEPEPASEQGRVDAMRAAESIGEPSSGGGGGQLRQQATATAEAATENPWAPLLTAGLKLIETLSFELSNGGTQTAAIHTAASPWVETDTRTGCRYLKLPMPEPQAIEQLGAALSSLIAVLRR